jgi:hypothetical protein
MKKLRKGQGTTEYLFILAAVLIIAAIAVYHVSTTAGAPPLGAHVIREDNTIVLKITTTGPEIPSIDWEYSITTTEGTRSWTGGVKAIGAQIEKVQLAEESSGLYYVSIRHVPTGHEWIQDKTIEIP